MVLSIKGIIITRPWGPTPSHSVLKVEKECNKHKMLGKNTKKVFYVFRDKFWRERRKKNTLAQRIKEKANVWFFFS